MSINAKDVYAGALFIVLGLMFGGSSYFNLNIGSMLRMGPGFFPIMLSLLLILLGSAIIFHGLRASPSPIGTVSWKAVCLVLAAPLLFALTVRGLGFWPATMLVVFVSAFASMRTSLATALILGVGVATVCALVFVWGLEVPLPLVGPWIGF